MGGGVHAARSSHQRAPRSWVGLGVVAGLFATVVLAAGAGAVGPLPESAVRFGDARDTGTRLPASSPLLTETLREFTTMTATRYQHHNQESTATGTYFYDCVGFVTYALGRSVPQARTTIMTRFSIRPGYVPSPARYVQFFNELGGHQSGWTPVHRVADLHPGDVVAWTYDHPTNSNGHAFVVAAPPRQDKSESWLVSVWDSTATPHGPSDTRRSNPKNLPGPNGKPSGLGRGTVRLDTNTDGTLTNVHWSPNRGTVPSARFGIGRPTGS